MVFGNLTVSVSLADSVQPHGVISLTFDDAWQNQYSNAFPLMQARGITGTFYVVTNKLTTNAIGTTYLTFPELQTMQNSGFEIGSHSVSHSSFATLTDSQIIQECQSSKSVLQSYGLTVNNFAYPYGAYNAHTDSIVSQYYRSARDVYCSGNASTLPYSQWHVFADNGAPGDPGCLSSLKSIVNQVYSTNKWAVFYFHQILPNVINSPDVINTQTFASFLDYIQSKGVPTLTVNQALNLNQTPAPVITPTPSPTPTSTSTSTASVFSSGFEDGLSSWSASCGGVSVVSSPVFSGSYALKCSDPSASRVFRTVGSQVEIYTEAEFYFDRAVAGSETFIAYLNGNGNPTASMGLSVQSGVVYAFVQTSLPSYSYSQYRLAGIAAGTWTKLALDASAVLAKIYVNDVQVASVSQANIPATASVIVGMFYGDGGYSGNLYIDNVQVGSSSASSSTPTSTPVPTPTPSPTPTSTSTSTASVFSSGFEDGLNSWSGTYGGVSVVSSPVYSGNYAMKAEYWGSQATAFVGTQSETYTEAEFYFDHDVAGQQTLIAYFNANGQPTVSMGISVQSGSVYAFVQTVLPSYSYSQYRLVGIAAGTWNKFALDVSSNLATIYLNGQQLRAISQADIPATVKVNVGIFWGNDVYAGNVYIDNVQIDTSVPPIIPT